MTKSDGANRPIQSIVTVFLILVAALAAGVVLRHLVRGHRLGLGRIAGEHLTPDHAEVGSPAAISRAKGVPERMRRSIGRSALAAAAFAIDMIPILGAAVLGYVLASSLIDTELSESIAFTLVNAGLVFATIGCVARAVAEPDLPALRLLPLADRPARHFVRWVLWVIGIAVFGFTIFDVGLQLGLEANAALALQKLVLLVDHILLMVLVLRNRRVVAMKLHAPKRHHGVLADVAAAFADIWHVIAIFVIMALWLIWAADWQGGYARLLQFAATAAGVAVVMRLITAGILIVLQHALHVIQPAGDGVAFSPEGIRPSPRLLRYYQVLRLIISGIATVFGAILVMEFCGITTLERLFANTLGRQIASAGFSILLTVAIAVVVWEGANFAVDRHLDRLSRQAEFARVARLRTLLPILRTAAAGGLLVLVALTTLSEIGVNIAPLLAGAGIVGVAIGFGSQKLVQDLITGIFLLLENAMQVGDFVTLAGVSGTVEDLSIRTIRLRAGDGSLHIIPFSSVTMVNNTNRGLGNAAVSVSIAAREDTDVVGEVLKTIVSEMRGDPRFKTMILGDLQFWGVDKVDGSQAVLVGQIPCTDSGRWGVQREFNRRYKMRFQELGIEIPLPMQTIMICRDDAPSSPPSPPAETEASATTVEVSPPSSSLGHSQ